MTKNVMSIENYNIIQNRLYELLSILDSLNEPLAAVHVNQAIEVVNLHAKGIRLIKEQSD